MPVLYGYRYVNELVILMKELGSKLRKRIIHFLFLIYDGLLNNKNSIFLAMLVSGFVTLAVLYVFLIAGVLLNDPLSIIAEGRRFVPTFEFVRILSFTGLIVFFFTYVPFKLGVIVKPITGRSGIVILVLLTYILSSASVAALLGLTTGIIDYEEVSKENLHTKLLLDNEIPCTFDFKESFFDTVSGFTTTGLTAFQKTSIHIDGKEVSKIDAQPLLIHVIRAAYLWIGGLGIVFFCLFFISVSPLMMRIGYEIPVEKSHPVSIRIEGLAIFGIYIFITLAGIFFLTLSILYARPWAEWGQAAIYSVILTFSSISTGGFSPGSSPINEMEIINNWSLLIIMGLMFAGAMPIFSLHRTFKFVKLRIFAVFLLPIVLVAVLSYSEDNPEVSLYRSFDAISAFTTTGLCTSQFEKDTGFIWDYEDKTHEVDTGEWIRMSFRYQLWAICLIILMFIGGAAYSTAGGFGFFSILFIIKCFNKFRRRKKMHKIALRHFLEELQIFIVFFLIFAIGTAICYESGLFGIPSSSGPATRASYIIDSAFYEISALSTVGLMPNSMLSNGGIYTNNLVYWVLVVSMLYGRLYRIYFALLIVRGGMR